MELGKKKGFFGKLSEKISNVIMSRTEVDEEFLEEIEEVLIMSDIGIDTTMTVMERLRTEIKDNFISKPEQIKSHLKMILGELMDKGEASKIASNYPIVILVIGINGSGKTTTIGKLAAKYSREGHKVMLAAADTFRAAASSQLSIWAERTGVPIVKHTEGADPSAVIFDAIASAKAKGIDVLICDTAGRLQTKTNLMEELKKMSSIIGREFPEAMQETLLVLDATTGKNAISQVEEFSKISELTGLVITKLDGTAKGGIAITIADQYDIPIKLIGIGEKVDDLREFDAAEFAGGIFDE